MANKRITDVDFINSLNSNESFFINQNNTIKQINKNNVVLPVSSLGITASADELNKLDGVISTTTELNYVHGVTSNIQTQIDDAKAQIDDKAQTSHASANTTYGVATGGMYGHVKLSDYANADNTVAQGVAATPAAVQMVADIANAAIPKANFVFDKDTGTLDITLT